MNALHPTEALEARISVVHEDDDLLVLNKPAGLVCHPTKSDAFSSLIGRVRLYLKDLPSIHMVNRLDRETGGLVLVAKNRMAAGELGKIIEHHGIAKSYIGITRGVPSPSRSTWTGALGKDTRSQVVVRDAVVSSGAAASTPYELISFWTLEALSDVDPCHAMSTFAASFGDTCRDVFSSELWRQSMLLKPFSLVLFRPVTGRKHQIRIHSGHAQVALLGDKIYGPDEQLYLRFVADTMSSDDWIQLGYPCHALHAWKLEFEWRGKNWKLSVDPHEWFWAVVPKQVKQSLNCTRE